MCSESGCGQRHAIDLRTDPQATVIRRSWLRLPGTAAPVELTAGGLLIYRPDSKHLLASTPFAECETTPPARVLPVSGAPAGAHAGLLCGYFEGSAADTSVVASLPDYLIWPDFTAYLEPLGRLMRTLTACALDETRCGQQILQHLCELAMLMILREPGVLKFDHIGVLCAQRDPVLCRVLNAIHARPNRRWTLAAMARSAGISRSAFAARFTRITGISAMRYVRRYRVASAERLMREEAVSAEKAARAFGYRSAGSFRRAARRS